ncbi:MAG TPA: TRAP transporter substrate-binding protein DctP [Acetobacteraceae bacterium]|jgi:TRAP-type C4-dicarboxylate transport system substrate-binding protein|nr:TRAP transporter substrate-binding protein DctP [Acetobacteraceae bacterium]
MSITKRGLINGALGAALAGGLARPALAAGARVIKISHQFPANIDFRDVLARKFAAEVEKRTNGALTFQIFPGGSLFKATQQFDAMANGALDMSVYPLAYSGGKLPAANLTLMPALIESYEQGYKWADAPIGKWLEGYLSDNGAELMTWVWQGGGVASHTKAIRVPADVKGLKTRGAGKMIELMLQAAGASISNFPSSETYNAMHSGVVDALWTSSASLMSFRLQEVAKDVTTARKYTFWYMFEPLLMAKSTFNSLTPGQQQIVKEVGHSLQDFVLASCKADDAKVAAVFGKAGDHVYDMDKGEFGQWKALARTSAYKNFADHVKDGKKLLDMAEAVA